MYLAYLQPMEWLDEKIFGWSRASKPRWTRPSRSEPSSSVHTPYDSDHESIEDDDADYDQVRSCLTVPHLLATDLPCHSGFVSISR